MAITVTNIKHVGSIPGCLALGSADIGQGIDAQGQTVYFAWGRNWSAKEAEQHGAAIVLPVAYIGDVWDENGKRGNYSPIIPDAVVERLRPLLVLTK